MRDRPRNQASPSLDDILQSGLDKRSAEDLAAALQHAESSVKNESAEEVWRVISQVVLRPDHPFPLHQLCHAWCYRGWQAAHKVRPPVWSPSRAGAADLNLARLMKGLKGPKDWEARKGCPLQDLPLLHELSCTHPDIFWPAVFQELRIRFHTPPSRMLQPASKPEDVRWLPGARLNIADSAICTRDPDLVALVWADEAMPQHVHTLTRGQLRWQSLEVAAALRHMNLQPGAAVAIAMPMTAEAVAAYLGIVLAGCVVVGIADSFAPASIADRNRISQARAIITQDVILRGDKKLPMYARVVAAKSPRAVVIPAARGQALQVDLRPGDIAWQDFLESAKQAPPVTPHIADAADPSNILFSSGTTGEPKAIPWTHTTPLRCAMEAWTCMDMGLRDVAAWPTNLGWMMGPWLIYASLLSGAAMALFHGSPLGRPFGEFIQAARVTFLGVVPSLVKTWRSSGCMQGLDWGAVRRFASTGEASAPDDSHWLSARGGYKPVIETIGGTEIGGSFLSGSMLQPQIPSTFSTPTLGTRLLLLRGAEGEERQQSPHGGGEACNGELTLVGPCLGWSQRLLNRDHHTAYYEGMPMAAGTSMPLRRHGDEMERLPNGYYVAHGRADDTMNLGGIKVSSVELERACVEGTSEVMEAAAVGVPTPGGGPDKLVLFLVLQPSSSQAADTKGLQKRCQAAIRDRLNPLFRLDKVLVRAALPRTASNKVMRRVLRDELRGPKAKL
ncbi:hypothetical protein WJX73_001758 [Symbiochloris irregularis]|uniref:Uncharacterized protein n=1 Tax=Symbiochloris irregularis TaxID=706552 RepID=A0AAW1P0R6_9CHLO